MLRTCIEKKEEKKKLWLQPGSNRERPHGSPVQQPLHQNTMC